jgi:hypothetical protein
MISACNRKENCIDIRKRNEDYFWKYGATMSSLKELKEWLLEKVILINQF